MPDSVVESAKMEDPRSAKTVTENPSRIEPTMPDEMPAPVADLVAEISAAASLLGSALHPRTAASLAQLVRIMNAYYSNLIEGHNTRPRDIVRALKNEFDKDEGRRNLQIEAAAHVRVQAEIDRMAAENALPEPASEGFVRWIHRDFYHGVPEAMLRVPRHGEVYVMQPGVFRSTRADDVGVGRHQPPASAYVESFMRYFEQRYGFSDKGKAARIVAMAAAHHRFNYIHPFPDGNGRVSRLMSHAMAHVAGVGAHGLWSVSRGLARGLNDRSEYKQMLDLADSPREDDLDGRGNLSQRTLVEFITWFLRVCLDQIRFMSSLFALGTLLERLRRYAERSEMLGSEAGRLLEEALMRGEFERGEASRITGLPERTARRVLNRAIAEGLLASETPKGPVSLRFSPDSAEALFPRLFVQT